jgi:hypothetical protein
VSTDRARACNCSTWTRARVLFSDAIDAEYCIYRVNLAETSSTLAGSYPAAYFDSFDAPRRRPRPV